MSTDLMKGRSFILFIFKHARSNFLVCQNQSLQPHGAPVNFRTERLVARAVSPLAASAAAKVEIFVMFRLIGNRVIIPLKIDMKVTCLTLPVASAGPAIHVAGSPAPGPASPTEKIKIGTVLCLPLQSCRSCFTCCHPMLSFICVRRKDLTSSVYNVHLARRIFHTNFE